VGLGRLLVHGTLPHNASTTKILLQRRDRRNKARSDKRFSKFHHVPSYFIVLRRASTHGRVSDKPALALRMPNCRWICCKSGSLAAGHWETGRTKVFHANPEATVPPCFFVATLIHVHEFRRHVEVT